MTKEDKVLFSRPGAIPGVDFELVNNSDGTGTRLEKWNESKLGPKPNLSSLLDPPPEFYREKEAREGLKELSRKDMRALIIWAAQHFGITPAQARDEIIAIRKGL